MQMIPVQCPNCHANLDVEEGRETLFCDFCGTKILLSDENHKKYTYHNDADVIRAETERIEQLHKMQVDSQKQKWSTALGVTFLVLAGLLFIAGSGAAGLLMAMLGGVMFFYNHSDVQNAQQERIRKVAVRAGADSYRGENYQQVIADLRLAGFTNIQTIPLQDMTKNTFFTKIGSVSQITINGNSEFTAHKKFEQNALVSISYHSLVTVEPGQTVVIQNESALDSLVNVASTAASAAIIAKAGQKIVRDIFKYLK